MAELILISQEMDAQACLVVDLEEDLGLNKLKPEHDQRKSVFFRHLELIRFDLGFLAELDEEFLVPLPFIPMRMMVRCEELPSLGGRSNRKPGNCAAGFLLHLEGIAAQILLNVT